MIQTQSVIVVSLKLTIHRENVHETTIRNKKNSLMFVNKSLLIQLRILIQQCKATIMHIPMDW